MKRFAVAVPSITTDEQKAFIEFIKDRGMGWWHRIGDLWLLYDRSDKIEIEEIRDHLIKTSARRGIVIEVTNDDNWAGFGPRSEADKVFDWVSRNWHKS